VKVWQGEDKVWHGMDTQHTISLIGRAWEGDYWAAVLLGFKLPASFFAFPGDLRGCNVP
jgi:hypothetical protein